jgi:cytochrome c
MTWHFSFSGRRAVRRSVAVAAVAAILVLGGCSGEAPRPAPATEPGRDGFAVLVFIRTTGFRHASINDGVAAMRRLGTANGFTVDVTQDPERIQDATLKGYRVVVFPSSTGKPLDPTQQAALERWVEAGGGWVGVHAAADAFYDWPWYGELVGAWFRRHPSVQRATVQVTDRSHPSTGSLPAAWTRTDEWYN